MEPAAEVDRVRFGLTGSWGECGDLFCALSFSWALATSSAFMASNRRKACLPVKKKCPSPVSDSLCKGIGGTHDGRVGDVEWED